jgi:hypothetical protein
VERSGPTKTGRTSPLVGHMPVVVVALVLISQLCLLNRRLQTRTLLPLISAVPLASMRVQVRRAAARGCLVSQRFPNELLMPALRLHAAGAEARAAGGGDEVAAVDEVSETGRGLGEKWAWPT